MIILKSPEEIEKIRQSCAIVAKGLHYAARLIAPGIKTKDIDREIESFLSRHGAKSAFKGYSQKGGIRKYPASICISINNEVVHGIPSSRRFKEGDIVSLDFGASYNGYYGDCAITVPVGRISEKATRLIEVTREALNKAIEQSHVGNRLEDISYAVQSFVEEKGYTVVRDFVGHGIGKSMHEDPQIPNFGKPGRGKRLQIGMVFALEPMVNEGDYRVKVMDDGWTVKTSDGTLSAHFEHTVAITQNGPDILTLLN
ncbi:MAG: type I methionyl aminopeptidase [bacterium]